MTTSGSGAYRYDWERGGIVHRDGQRFRLTPRQEQIYAALDACRGQPISGPRLAQALYGFDGTRHADNIRVQISHMRRKHPGIIETVNAPSLGLSKKGSAYGYIVRRADGQP